MSDRVPTGMYAAGITWCGRRGARGFMLRLRAELIGIVDSQGLVRTNMAGRSFFFGISTRIEKSFNSQRWFDFARATGETGLQNNTNEEDFNARCIAQHVIGAACLMQVATSHRGEFVDHEVKRFISPQDPEQQKMLETWRESFLEREKEGFGDDREEEPWF